MVLQSVRFCDIPLGLDRFPELIDILSRVNQAMPRPVSKIGLPPSSDRWIIRELLILLQIAKCPIWLFVRCRSPSTSNGRASRCVSPPWHWHPKLRVVALRKHLSPLYWNSRLMYSTGHLWSLFETGSKVNRPSLAVAVCDTARCNSRSSCRTEQFGEVCEPFRK